MSTIQSDESNARAPETAGEKLAAKRAEKAARKAAARGTQNVAVEEVEKSVLAATSWFDEHGRTVVTVCGIGLAILAGYQFWSMQSRGVAEKAGDLFYTAVQTANGLVLGENQTPPEDALVPTFTSAQERDEKALSEYREVTKQFAQSEAGRWAKLGEANSLLALGKHADAAKAFDEALAAAGDDSFLRFRSLEGAAYALEADRKRDEAQKKLDELAKLDGGTYNSVAEYHRARMLAAEGKRDEARKVLEGISVKHSYRVKICGCRLIVFGRRHASNNVHIDLAKF